jgi:hypothetical protein
LREEPCKINMTKEELLEIAKPYGVKEINFGGCLEGQKKGFKGAMRRSAHAHNSPKYPEYGLICFKGGIKHAIGLINNKPTQLFWHEVAHIYRKSWTQTQCDKWGWQMVRK